MIFDFIQFILKKIIYELNLDLFNIMIGRLYIVGIFRGDLVFYLEFTENFFKERIFILKFEISMSQLDGVSRGVILERGNSMLEVQDLRKYMLY